MFGKLRKKPPPHVPFGETSGSQRRKAQAAGTCDNGSPVPASLPFLQSLCLQVETSLRLKPGKYFSFCRYQLGFRLSCVFRQLSWYRLRQERRRAGAAPGL